MMKKSKNVILWVIAIIIIILVGVCANYYLRDEFLNLMIMGGI